MNQTELNTDPSADPSQNYHGRADGAGLRRLAACGASVQIEQADEGRVPGVSTVAISRRDLAEIVDAGCARLARDIDGVEVPHVEALVPVVHADADAWDKEVLHVGREPVPLVRDVRQRNELS